VRSSYAENLGASRQWNQHRIDADPDRSLLGVLRDDLDLTGSKYGSAKGMWRLHRAPRWASYALVRNQAWRGRGKKIITIESLEQNGRCIRFRKPSSMRKHFSALTAHPDDYVGLRFAE